LAGCGAGYVEVMVGTLRTGVGRAVGARGTWITCALLLSTTLLGGCHQTDSSSAAAQPAATAQPASPGVSASTPQTKAARNVEVSWSAPTTNTNGSALTNLAGYRVYYGTSPGALSQSADVPSAGAVSFIVRGLGAGTWYFAVAAYTNTGLESTYSSVVSKTIT